MDIVSIWIELGFSEKLGVITLAAPVAWYLLRAIFRFVWGEALEVRLTFLVSPVPPLKGPPKELEPWVFFDTGERPAVIEILNKGSGPLTLKRVCLSSAGGSLSDIGGVVLEAPSSERMFRPFMIAGKTSCRFRTTLPIDAFADGRVLAFFFDGYHRPETIRIPDSRVRQG